MKTYSAKPTDITRKWHLVDASELPLGRLSTTVASLLTGKGKVTYTPHMNGGDFVVVVNADKLVTTGDKVDKKQYYRHSGYPGGIKQLNLQQMVEKDSTEVIKLSVKGMLHKNKLQDQRMLRLKVYAGSQHNHQAQSPKALSLKKGKK